MKKSEDPELKKRMSKNKLETRLQVQLSRIHGNHVLGGALQRHLHYMHVVNSSDNKTGPCIKMRFTLPVETLDHHTLGAFQERFENLLIEMEQEAAEAVRTKYENDMAALEEDE